MNWYNIRSRCTHWNIVVHNSTACLHGSKTALCDVSMCHSTGSHSLLIKLILFTSIHSWWWGAWLMCLWFISIRTMLRTGSPWVIQKSVSREWGQTVKRVSEKCPVLWHASWWLCRGGRQDLCLWSPHPSLPWVDGEDACWGQVSWRVFFRSASCPSH